MEENVVLEKLGAFGLTRQEANIYLCLFRQGELNGYEVAKYTGISRSNVYSGLSALTDKGAAYLIEGNSNKYMAVPIVEFCENKIRNLNQEKEYLMEHIPSIHKKEIGYITISGSQNIWDKMICMIKKAEKRIYISASKKVIEKLQNEFYEVISKGIKLVVITDDEMKDLEKLNGSIWYAGSAKEDNIRLIIDSEYALAGELTGEKENTCLYTGQKNFITVFKENLRNEIKLIQLQTDTVAN
ncbi:MAG: TrmB family transcriptional regulator [Lachnospiraceae bacterium]|nr:TrmB family transcriptional regulator [Lachnospiraceae bacterium]